MVHLAARPWCEGPEKGGGSIVQGQLQCLYDIKRPCAQPKKTDKSAQYGRKTCLQSSARFSRRAFAQIQIWVDGPAVPSWHGGWRVWLPHDHAGAFAQQKSGRKEGHQKSLTLSRSLACDDGGNGVPDTGLCRRCLKGIQMHWRDCT